MRGVTFTAFIELIISLGFFQPFQGQPTTSTTVTVPHPPVIRPRVRARRGQATDPHSIAERVIRLIYHVM